MAAGSNRDEEPGTPEPPRAPKRWPAGARFEDSEGVACACPGCGLPWLVHRDLAGFRMQCACGAWVVVPRLEPVVVPFSGIVERTQPTGAPPTSFDEEVLSEHRALVPYRDRQRRAGYAVLAAASAVLAFWIPSLVLEFATIGNERVQWMAGSYVAACLLVLAIGWKVPGWTFGALVPPRPRHVVEAAFAAAVGVGLAFALIAYLRSRAASDYEDSLPLVTEVLGLPMALFVIGVLPAVFEELAFRGLVHSVLVAYAGPLQAILIGGAVFGLAHGVTSAFMLHAGIGLYLGWLRHRSGSLYPGMLVHLLYNGTLVAAEAV
jgi:membrane protease YdiL (CAAX protease family)